MKNNIHRIVLVVGLITLALIVIASNKVSTRSNVETRENELTNIFLKHYNASKIIISCQLKNGKYKIEHVYRGASILNKVAFPNGVLMRNPSFPLFRRVKTTNNLLFIFYPSKASKLFNVEYFAIFNSKIDVGAGEMNIDLLENPVKVNAFVTKLLKASKNASCR